MMCVCCSLSYIIIYSHYFNTAPIAKISVYDGAKSGNTVAYYSGYDPDDWACAITNEISGYVQWKHNNSTVICGKNNVPFEIGSLALEDAGTYTCEVFPQSCQGEYINDGYCNITALNNDCSPIDSDNRTVVIIGK